MNRTTKIFLAYGIGIIAILLVLTLLFATADRAKLAASPQFSLELNFGATMGTLLAVALALITIGYGIKRSQIRIYLGDKSTGPSGTVQQIRVVNTGDAMADLAFATIEIYVPTSSKVSFSAGDTGLPLQEIQMAMDKSRKLYRFDGQVKPESLYPDKDAVRSFGFIEIPPKAANHVRFRVQIVGTHGLTQNKFRVVV